MKFLRLFTLAGLIVFALASCTVVTSTNVPGKKNEQIPKNLQGRYELQYPEDLQALMESAGKTYVTFKSDRIVIENDEGPSETILGDSLYISTIGKQVYLSLGKEPNLSVFKVTKEKKDLLLYGMSTDNYISAADLNEYFSKVEEIPGEANEEGEPGMSSFIVTIDDAKLDKYFKSGVPMKEPFRLKRAK